MAGRASLPIAQEPAATVRPLNLPQATPDAFGAARGRALQRAGAQVSGLGAVFEKIGAAEIERKDSADVMHAYTSASTQLRGRLYDPDKGILTLQGADAWNAAKDLEPFQDRIFQEAMRNLPSEGARTAFERMWSQHVEGVSNTVAAHVAGEARQYRADQSKALLENSALTAADNFTDQDAIDKAIANGKTVILANSEGAPVDTVNLQMKEYESGVHTAVVLRMALDDPKGAGDYVEAHKGVITGPDRIKIDDALRVQLRKSNATDIFNEVWNAGGGLVRAVIGRESEGDPTAVSPKGATGLMQVMPDTGTDIARQLGDKAFPFGGSDEDKQAYMMGEGVNLTYGTFYLQQQLDRYGGDVEAALVAYNAGPQRADEWLQAGRDDSVLPAETRAYVPDVMRRWRGDTGVQITGAREAKQALLPFVRPGLGKEHLDGMSDLLAVRLSRMFEAMPLGVRAGTQIYSGFRSNERQAQLYAAAVQKYGSPQAARRWVAPPGRSQHNHGRAADLHFGSDAAREWMHAHAAEFGLTFPLGNEAWHIETQEARRPGPTVEAAAAGRAGQDAGTLVDLASGNAILDLGGVSDEGATQEPLLTPPLDFSGTVAVTPGSVTVGDTLTARGTARADTSELDPDAMMAAAETKTSDPETLELVRRQIAARVTLENKARSQALKTVQQDAFAQILGGARVEDLPPQMTMAIGPEYLNTLSSLEDRLRKGDDETDEAVSYRLSSMTDEELSKVDLMQLADKLSRADLTKFADRQNTFINKPDSGQIAGLRTAREITNDAIAAMGLDPAKKDEDAVTAGLFRARVDQEILLFNDQNGKPPNAVELQAIVDRLTISGRTADGGWLGSDTRKRLFEATPEELKNFETAQSAGDVPVPVMRNLSARFVDDFGRLPEEDEAVQLYNDAIRVQNGVAVMPPEDAANEFTAGLAAALGRSVTDAEVAAAYSRYVSRYIQPGAPAPAGVGTASRGQQFGPPGTAGPPPSYGPPASAAGGRQARPPAPGDATGAQPFSGTLPADPGQQELLDMQGAPTGGGAMDQLNKASGELFPALDVPLFGSMSGYPNLAKKIADGELPKRHDTGTAVEELQAFLNSKGITSDDGEPLEVDGEFGELTDEAMRSFALKALQQSMSAPDAAQPKPAAAAPAGPKSEYADLSTEKVRGRLAEVLNVRDEIEDTKSERWKTLNGRADALLAELRRRGEQ